MIGSSFCSPNARAAFDFFMGRGLTDVQAAAIIGNLQQESGLNPLALNPNDVGMPAHGLAQWRGSRWDSLQAFAAASGRDPNALDLQLDFILHELPTNGGSAFFAATTLEDATTAFQDGFERCGDCNTPARIASARAAFSNCPLVTPPVATPQAPPRSTAPVLFLTLGAAALAAAAGYATLQERRGKLVFA